MKAKRFLILAIGLLLSHSVSVLFADKPSFRGIGNLQGTSDGWMAISEDGLTAVGYRQLESDPYEAFYWTVSSGIIGLGYLPGGNLSTAAGISADGSVVVGYSKSSLGGQAFRWTEAEGMVGLYDLPGGRFYSTAYNVSADGSVVVGFSGSESAVDYEAFRWTASNGMIGLGDLPGGEYESRAYAVSADGSVVVGYSKSASGEQAFRWTESEGMSGLGYLSGGFSQAYGISPDGSVVVGRASSLEGAVAFRWTDSEGMVSLGDLPGGSVSGTAYDASTNGSIIVGMSNSFNDFEAFIWDEDNGIRSLQDLLINNYHLDLNGWHLRCAYGISDDGKVIVGSGNNPQGQREGWIAVLTELEPAIIYVDDDAAGANNGSSWADAYNDLQDALAIAWSGDEIRVAQGIYKPGPPEQPGPPEPPLPPQLPPGPPPPPPASPRSATFQLKNGVTLKGGYAGTGTDDPNTRDIELYETILSGDLNDDDGPNFTNNGENSYHVVTGSGTNETTILDGFTVRGGNANENYPFAPVVGGGMWNYLGSPIVTNCVFKDNAARGYGGGMYNEQSSPTLFNCDFRCNAAEYSGSGMCNREGSNPTVTNCTFSYNIGLSYHDSFGAGMYNCESNPTVNNCAFIENSGSLGAGMYNYYSNPTLKSCTFTGNTVHEGGGGMSNLESSPTLINCTFSGNWSDWYGVGGMENCCSSNPILTNCILWNDMPGEISGSAVVTYSNVQGGWPGTGNIDTYPSFVSPGYWDTNDTPENLWDDFWVEGDYHLLPGSPCIDAGDPNYIAGPNETDLDGRPRIIGGRIDMGAYETPIFAEARILPRTINLASKGKWITCYIWLSDDYDIADIDPGCVLLEKGITPEQFSVDEEKQVATATFDREKVQSILNVGDIELTISCRLTDGTYFEATDIIQVTDKGPK